MPELPKEFVNRLRAITAKRPKTVIDHILRYGYVTTEDLNHKYGYDHPPRAARDVREQGIPLETFYVRGAHGRKIGAYKFGDPSQAKGNRFRGRKTWPKMFKQLLVKRYGSFCGICLTKYESRYLQIDHRVPYEVAGDAQAELDPAEFMLVCGSCNRAKSWSCEHCQNCLVDHEVNVCESCYWATPGSYTHVALRFIRRLDIVWSEEEVLKYDRLVEISNKNGQRLSDFVKDVLLKRAH